MTKENLTSTVNEQAVAKAWENRGFSFGIWIDPPGQEWIDYMHATDELFMLVKGQLELTIDAQVFHPSPGEEILISKNTKHSVKNIGEIESRWLYGYKKNK